MPWRRCVVDGPGRVPGHGHRSYQEWVLVTLKSGKEHDLHITLAEFQKKIEDAHKLVNP